MATDGLDNLALTAARRLAEAGLALISAVAESHGLSLAEVGDIELPWRAGMPPEELLENAELAVAELAAADEVFCPGRVYCYACQSAACRHSRPPGGEYVFAGYAATGAAQWIELYSLLLNLGDPRTELLFRRPPRMIARFVARRNLVEQQLASFGKNSLTYRIWGQVVAGYLSFADLRCAMTVQLVETRDHRLHLQVVAPELLLGALAESTERGHSPWRRIHDALADARRQIESAGKTWRQSRSRETKRKAKEQANGVLRHLSHSIERKGKQEKKRTSHAELRSTQKRPIHKAGDDCAIAQNEDFYRDVIKDAYVVTGKGGRLHVFAKDGRHVTSLHLAGDELARRLQRRRYQPLADVEVAALRKRLAD